MNYVNKIITLTVIMFTFTFSTWKCLIAGFPFWGSSNEYLISVHFIVQITSFVYYSRSYLRWSVFGVRVRRTRPDVRTKFCKLTWTTIYVLFIV